MKKSFIDDKQPKHLYISFSPRKERVFKKEGDQTEATRFSRGKEV